MILWMCGNNHSIQHFPKGNCEEELMLMMHSKHKSLIFSYLTEPVAIYPGT